MKDPLLSEFAWFCTLIMCPAAVNVSGLLGSICDWIESGLQTEWQYAIDVGNTQFIVGHRVGITLNSHVNSADDSEKICIVVFLLEGK